ncbi:MAG TPA: hypothetical protein VE010_05460, partial [Thermoanaerobaculia bacterium]|nr:hypothetical protein [Thermoanaerobaculia bacterium]
MASNANSKPLILLIEPHEEHHGRGRDFLVADCSETFEVVTMKSVEDARAAVTRAETAHQPIVLILVRHILDQESIRELLQQAKHASAGVKVILYAGDLDPGFALDAKREGLVDYTLDDPWEAPETALEPIVRDALRAWETVATANDVVEIIGDQWQPRCHNVKDLLARHRVPYRWVDTTGDDDEERESDEAPRIVFPDGTELVDPTDAELAQKHGYSTSPDDTFYDLVIVGGGPAGLAAA